VYEHCFVHSIMNCLVHFTFLYMPITHMPCTSMKRELKSISNDRLDLRGEIDVNDRNEMG